MKIGSLQNLKHIQDTPSWFFPVISHTWEETYTVEEYAQKFVESVQQNDNYPIWLELRAWMGLGRWGFDDNGVLNNVLDRTVQGTYSLWPDNGVRIWKERHRKFLAYLKENDITPEFIILSGKYIPASKRLLTEEVCANITQDDRWKNKPVIGFDKTCDEIIQEANVNISCVNDCCSNLFFTVSTLEANLYSKALKETFIDINDSSGIKSLVYNSYGRNFSSNKVVQKILEITKETKINPVGNIANLLLFGDESWLKKDKNAQSITEAMLNEVDNCLSQGLEVFPYVTFLDYCINRRDVEKNNVIKKHLDADEYGQLFLELKNRDIQNMILFFDPNLEHSQEVEQFFIDTINNIL